MTTTERAPWELTAAEYIDQRIARSDVSREEYLDHYSIGTMTADYHRAIRQTPRDFEIDLSIYDALPTGVQSELYKFNFTLRQRLINRDDAGREEKYKPINAALAIIRPRIANLEAKARNSKGNLSETDSKTLNRLRAAEHSLEGTFVPYDQKLATAARYTGRTPGE